MRTVIVDDERLARKRVRRLLEAEPDVAVVGEYANAREALERLDGARADLLFLDIQMPGMDGFELLERLGAGTIPAVIFVTAYEQYAVRAFDVRARDYLLKPFDKSRFREAVQRARDTVTRSIAPEEYNRPAIAKREAVLVRTAGRARFVNVKEIDWIESGDNYARLHVGPETHLVRETMAALESHLPVTRFVRIHRSTIVNIERIVEFQQWFNGDYQVLLKGGNKLRMSRTYRERIQDLLGHSI